MAKNLSSLRVLDVLHMLSWPPSPQTFINDHCDFFGLHLIIFILSPLIEGFLSFWICHNFISNFIQLTNLTFSQELVEENRVLNALLKRQERALKKYEGEEAQLPQLIKTHSDEMRVLQTKYKQVLKFFNSWWEKLNWLPISSICCFLILRVLEESFSLVPVVFFFFWGILSTITE